MRGRDMMRRFVGALCVLACVALVGCVPSGREWFDPPEGKTSFEKRQTISEFMAGLRGVYRRCCAAQ